jgi:hypothetical protein
MQKYTEIDDPYEKISTMDAKMQGLTFYGNKHVEYLPVGVSKNFPALVAYSAVRCSITAISKKNFRGLKNLLSLSLSRNYIETIFADTFDDLEQVEIILLGELNFQHHRKSSKIFILDVNKIKFMSGKLFLHLKNLENLDLVMNSCIDERFTDPKSLKTLEAKLNKNCHFDEEIIHCQEDKKELMTKIEKLLEEIKQMKDENLKLKKKLKVLKKFSV